eukprot:gnl/MRDRNA2_/MRDRNA2_56503_c0_seq1.p1 gnl/MRDRNA2_/MRDRNA2_56503_c0~~gnl/MRDRNA2_/MRDRNA2_56503_c0_seq1.p1  ORF type:complete len:271 (-),score=69.92 gnl/MRDRNA2_/MRDRNA2_56503_c0_seq1:102-914(-)
MSASVERNLAALREIAAEVIDSMSIAIDCSLVSDEEAMPDDKFVKKVNFIRHGEGHHNVAHEEWCSATTFDGKSVPYTIDEDPDLRYVDAELTEKGKKEAEALQARTYAFMPDVLVVSPMRRATQTGLVAFAAHLEKGLKVEACELCHERGGKHTCDKRLNVSLLKLQFPAVDYSFLEFEEDPFWKDGLCRESWLELAMRAATFAKWLGDRPEKHIAVAAHGHFLLSVFNVIFQVDTEQTSKFFDTGEMRTVILKFRTIHNPACDSGFGA